MIDSGPQSETLRQLSEFVREECSKRLKAYEAQPRDAGEHFGTENEVLSGGYAYRQLYELVQNAADAILEAGEPHGRIHVRLSSKRLETANTGAALDEGGIVALLNAHSSPKRGNQIGRFGIGFKSLLKLGGRVDLISRSVGLRFDPEACRNRIREHLGLASDARAPGMRLADVLDPDAAGSPLSKGGDWSWATTVVAAEISDQSAYARLRKEIADFPAEFLLFLPSDISLTLEVVGDEPRVLTRRIEDSLAIVSDGSNESSWKVFETKVRVKNPEALSDATHIQARDEVPLSWAVPVGGREQAGRFWAFFPTETQSRTSGILNAPWKLNSDRTNLIRGPWNEAIMEAAADLIGSSLSALPTPEDRGAAVSAFPRQPERQDEIAVPLIKALWDRIVTSEILPNADGTPCKPSKLARHFVEDADICGTWAELANAEARQQYVHAHCYMYEARISRLSALAAEAKRREMIILSKPSAENWLNCIATTDPAAAKRVIAFVGDLLSDRYHHGLYSIPEARIIPATDGRLAFPSEAVLVSGAAAPAGFLPVADQIASDPLCREILTDQLDVKVLETDSWAEVLEASLSNAEASDEPEDWKNFWCNLTAAPEDALTEFTAGTDIDRLKFRSSSNKWSSRDMLVVGFQSTDVPAEYLMDDDFRKEIKDRVPEDWLSEFPSIHESVYFRDSEITSFLQWLSPSFNELCRQRVGSTPQYLPKFVGSFVHMPAGWRLLRHLQRGTAARLTMRMVEACSKTAALKQTVTIAHPTRENSYPKIKAPHPVYHLLNEHGRVEIGDLVVQLNCISSDFADLLANAGVPGFREAAIFFEVREMESSFSPPLAWTRRKLTPESAVRVWEQIFKEMETRTSSFADLRDLWELAHSDGAVPTKVPTADGPLPLTEIHVTIDQNVEHDLEDGRIVLLSTAAAAAWIEAGAKRLEGRPKLEFRERLSTPCSLLDLFPDLIAIDHDADGLRRVPMVWVKGLEETLGPITRPAVLGMDLDGALLIDRDMFRACGWAAGVELVARCLARHGLIEEGEDFEARLAGVLDRRSDAVRETVRSESTLERRLLKAINGDLEVLLGVLTPATRQAVGTNLQPEELARLALAVHGPTLLSKLRDALELNGLEPPGRWGGEPARAFVLDIGFPVEFATSTSGRRDAELLVSGPISLPPLHDYQEEILEKVDALLAKGSGRRRAVISLPTGGGKTRVAAEAVVRLVLCGEGRRTALWIAQTDELCEQAVQCFRQLWVNVGEPGEVLRVVRLWGGQKNPAPPDSDEATVVVASIQTLNSRSGRPELAWITQVGIVIIDECHHAITSSYTDLLRWLDVQVGSERARESEVPVLGLSATPWRGHDEEESERLAARFDRRWLPADQEGLHDRLSRMGVLADRGYHPLRYDRPVTLTAREQQHVETFGELPDTVVDRMGEDADRNDLIVDAVLQSSASSILLFANSVSHAQYLAARLHLAGCPSAAVSGETDRLARQHFTRRFKAGEIRVICNHSVLTTGFDAPKTDLILISRPVFSPVLYMQMVGRGLRGPANGGTNHCEIMTVEDNIVNFRDQLAYHFCRRFFE